MTGPLEIVQSAIELKREASRSYPVFARRITNSGLRSLIVSVAEQEKDQAEAMQELLRKTRPEQLFSHGDPTRDSQSEAVSRPYESGAIPEQDASALDVLAFLMTATERTVRLYEELRSLSVDPDAQGLFERLAAESQRTHAIVESRYDLETLGREV
jgi:rubrerythrin